MDEKEFEIILNRHIKTEGNLTSILQDMQETFGYIPQKAVEWLAEQMGVPESSFYGIATFYNEFYLKARGKNIVTACCDTACYVKGSEGLVSSMKQVLSIKGKDDTSDDGKFTIEKGSCVGACSIAPVVTVGKKIYGQVTPDKALEILKDHDK
jgi:NADH:ubiquinone oxidoreductase subunit E